MSLKVSTSALQVAETHSTCCAVWLQTRVSEAQLQGEADCASLQTKLDKTAATMQAVASEHQELTRQRKALDRKLVRLYKALLSVYSLLSSCRGPNGERSCCLCVSREGYTGLLVKQACACNSHLTAVACRKVHTWAHHSEVLC